MKNVLGKENGRSFKVGLVKGIEGSWRSWSEREEEGIMFEGEGGSRFFRFLVFL